MTSRSLPQRTKLMVAMAAMAAALGSVAPDASAAGKITQLGKGPDGWVYTAADEGKGITNCRAVRKKGGRDDIIAMRTDGHSYLSVRAEGRNAKYPDSIITLLNQSNGNEWTETVEANGKRMWVVLPPGAIDMITAAGGYDIYLGGTEDTDKVTLGKKAQAAWIAVRECVVNYGG